MANTNEQDAYDYLIPDDLKGDEREECRRLIFEFEEKIREEQEAASEANSLSNDLEDLGVNSSALIGAVRAN